ncbi:MAG: ATP-grasp domain-containing protein [Patescibacteria group bacterium]|jgi:carbamoyl-phosphate synthase large subunit
MSKIPILLTSVGVETGPNVISALRKATEFSPFVIGVANDSLSAGLYLSDKKEMVPTIDSPDYIGAVDAICQKYDIQIIIPLLSKEIALFSQKRSYFKQKGIRLAVSSPEVISLCADKSQFLTFLLSHGIPAPRLLSKESLKESDFPIFAKPVTGSSSRFSLRLDTKMELNYLEKQVQPLKLSLQELLVGPEYTIDTLSDLDGNFMAGAIRERLSVKDGKSVKGRTVKNDRLMEEVRLILSLIKIVGPANLQCIEENGEYKFFEINTRFSAGGLPLTVAAGLNTPVLLIKMLLDLNIDPTELEYKPDVYISRYLTEVFPNIERSKG